MNDHDSGVVTRESCAVNPASLHLCPCAPVPLCPESRKPLNSLPRNDLRTVSLAGTRDYIPPT